MHTSHAVAGVFLQTAASKNASYTNNQPEAMLTPVASVAIYISQRTIPNTNNGKHPCGHFNSMPTLRKVFHAVVGVFLQTAASKNARYTNNQPEAMLIPVASVAIDISQRTIPNTNNDKHPCAHFNSMPTLCKVFFRFFAFQANQLLIRFLTRTLKRN